MKESYEKNAQEAKGFFEHLDQEDNKFEVIAKFLGNGLFKQQ